MMQAIAPAIDATVEKTQVAAGVGDYGDEEALVQEVEEAEQFDYGEEGEGAADDEGDGNLEDENNEEYGEEEDYLDSPENYLLQEGNKMIEQLGDAVFVD